MCFLRGHFACNLDLAHPETVELPGARHRGLGQPELINEYKSNGHGSTRPYYFVSIRPYDTIGVTISKRPI